MISWQELTTEVHNSQKRYLMIVTLFIFYSLADNVIKIVLPIAIVAVVLIGVILFILGRKRRRQRNSHDFDYEGKNSYKLNYNPYTQPELGLKNEKFENE